MCKIIENTDDQQLLLAGREIFSNNVITATTMILYCLKDHLNCFFLFQIIAAHANLMFYLYTYRIIH